MTSLSITLDRAEKISNAHSYESERRRLYLCRRPMEQEQPLQCAAAARPLPRSASPRASPQEQICSRSTPLLRRRKRRSMPPRGFAQNMSAILYNLKPFKNTFGQKNYTKLLFCVITDSGGIARRGRNAPPLPL
jgi:hypothetical protein